jgi:hypothetical protein
MGGSASLEEEGSEDSINEEVPEIVSYSQDLIKTFVYSSIQQHEVNPSGQPLPNDIWNVIFTRIMQMNREIRILNHYYSFSHGYFNGSIGRNYIYKNLDLMIIFLEMLRMPLMFR